MQINLSRFKDVNNQNSVFVVFRSSCIIYIYIFIHQKMIATKQTGKNTKKKQKKLDSE